MRKSALNTVLATLLVILFSNNLHVFREAVEPADGNQVNLTVLTTDVGLAPMVELWVDEVHRRYNDAIIVDGHGGTEFVDGKPVWHAYTVLQPDGIPVADLIASIRQREPWRRIVLLFCNPDGLPLEGVANVSYSLQNVWVVPDSHLGAGANVGRDAWYGDSCGDIFEFVEVN